MKTRLKKTLRNFILQSQRLVGLDKQALLMGQIRAKQIADEGKLNCLSDAEFSVFSQWGEDGIISWLVARIQPENKTFVEFGVEDFREANMRYLLMSQNWRGLVIDGSKDNIRAIKADAISYKHGLDALESFITKDNINTLFDQSNVAPHLGILSVDIDGVDYWVLEQINRTADIVIVEYNASFDPHPISVAYDPAFVRAQKHWSNTYWGASLSAFRHLLESRDYVFVGTNSVGTNAFFVSAAQIDKIAPYLEEYRAFPCSMRDTRDKTGKLTLKPYEDFQDELKNHKFVDVVSGEEKTGSNVFSARQT